jgi:hypothetical protein
VPSRLQGDHTQEMQRIRLTRINIENRPVQSPSFVQLPAAVLTRRCCK